MRTDPTQGPQTSDEELLQILMETVSDSIYFKDRESRFIRVSRSLAEKDGITDPALLIGKTDFDRFTAEHAQLAYEDEQRILTSGEPIIDLEEKETWPDGRISWVSTSKFPLRNRHGDIVGTFGISRDITSRKLTDSKNLELERQLEEAQKLESIGRLAAGVAHEINTPTQFISDNVRFVQSSLAPIFDLLSEYRVCLNHLTLQSPEGADTAGLTRKIERLETDTELAYLQDEMPKALAQALEGLASITRIVRSLKEISHPDSPEPLPADLNHVIQSAINISRHEWKYVATVQTDLDPALPRVPCILNEITQVILNLIINAAHAIADTPSAAEGELGLITLRSYKIGNFAVIDVEDTGTGIRDEVKPRIFEPFFTTKAVGKGTGQGLAIVRNVIVKHHAGQVGFKTEVGRGTTFTLKLPLTRST